MNITISVSDKTAEIIQNKAEENGKEIADFASDLFEEKIKEEYKENGKNEEPHPLLKMAGMFSSGKTDISWRYKEILMEDIDKRGGFGGS